jgi:hypothetical protein
VGVAKLDPPARGDARESINKVGWEAGRVVLRFGSGKAPRDLL